MNEPPNPPSDPGLYLAVERTFLAWLRTGVAFMGFGFVVARFGLFLYELALEKLAAYDPHSGLSLPVGIALIGVGIVVSLAAAIRHRAYVRAIDRGQFRAAYGSGFVLWVAGVLAAIGLAVAIYLAVLL